MRGLGALPLLVFTFACGSSPSVAPPARVPQAAPHVHRKPVARDAVERARTTFRGRQPDGTDLPQATFLERISEADLLCVGERHDDPAHHFVQLAVVEHAVSRAPQTGRRIAVGLEMLPRSAQPALDRFARGELSEEAFLESVRWDETWGFDYALYRPVIDAALEGGADLVALNADRAVVRAVARGGLSALAPGQRAELPDLVLDDREHRSFFDEAMREHPDVGKGANHYYVAQVLWDETMAETAARWLSDGSAPRQLVVLAGAGHCHESAIVRRVERRLAVDAIGLRVMGRGEPDDAKKPAVDFEILLDATDPTTVSSKES